MLILAFESSAKAASVCLWQDGELLAQSYQRGNLTHSRTLLPMAQDLLKNSDLTLDAVDAIAVAQGPGSFTGIRIGIATVKGLCWGAEKPAIGVSTLESMACAAFSEEKDAVICPCMDARRSQLYNALFEKKNGQIIRITPDRALAAEELADELKKLSRPVFLLGDGWRIASEALKENGVAYTLAPENLRWQTAYGVAAAAAGKTPVSAEELLPTYLRLSQAERERQERIN